MGKRLVAILAVLLFVGAIGFVAGCGDDDDDEGGDTAAATTETSADTGGGGATSVAMSEYQFDPSDETVASGDTIELSNDGQIPHNYTIVEGDPEGGGAEVAASDDIEPGGTGSLAVDAEPGEYGVLCTIPGHAEQGMTGSITVD